MLSVQRQRVRLEANKWLGISMWAGKNESEGDGMRWLSKGVSQAE